MKSFTELVHSYETYHTKPFTKLTHAIGIPAIIFAVQIWLSWLTIFHLSLAWIGIFVLLVYYLLLNRQMGLICALFLLPLTYLAQVIATPELHSQALWISGIAFIAGWFFQLLGHGFEGNKPALLDNYFQIFVAPIFLIYELLKALGYKNQILR